MSKQKSNKTKFEGNETKFEATVIESDNQDNISRTKRISLPECIAEKYQYVKDLPSGAESDAVLLQDLQTGEQVFFKFYRPGFSPDPVAMILLKNADPNYVSKLIDFHDSDDGCWEIQEYCPHGSLETWMATQVLPLSDEQVKRAAREISSSLKYLHSLGSGIAHRDLKPSNILVKSTEPLKLVLADFGLAKAHQNLTHLTTTVKGTWHYAAPEVQSKQSSAKSDWFSLGAILYELTTGFNLFSDAQGKPVSDDEARARCMSGLYSTKLVKNGRIRLLIDGLLIWDKNDRWGATEVDQWLDGKSPKVPQQKVNTQKPDTSTSKSRINYRASFSPELASNFADLARMIREHWRPFADMLAGRIDEKLIRFIEVTGESPEFLSASKDAHRVITGPDLPEYKLVQLQVLLDPSVTPVFRNRKLDNATILQTIENANEGNTEAREWVDALVGVKVFGALSEIEILGSNELAEKLAAADYYLSMWTKQIDSAIANLPSDYKEIGQTAKASAGPFLVASALTASDPQNSETICSINKTSAELCAQNYVSKTELVKPIIEKLRASNSLDDVGEAIIFNAYLTQVYEAEIKRAESVYKQAQDDIKAMRFPQAIEKLKTIESYKDSAKLLAEASSSLAKAKSRMADAQTAIEAGDFEKAFSIFTELHEYEDSATMALVSKRAIAYIEMKGFRSEEKKLSDLISDLKKKLDESAKKKNTLTQKLDVLNQQISASEHLLSNVILKERKAQNVIDGLCADAERSATAQINELRGKRLIQDSQRASSCRCLSEAQNKLEALNGQIDTNNRDIKGLEQEAYSAAKRAQETQNEIDALGIYITELSETQTRLALKVDEAKHNLEKANERLSALSTEILASKKFSSRKKDRITTDEHLETAKEAVKNAEIVQASAREDFQSNLDSLGKASERLAKLVKERDKELNAEQQYQEKIDAIKRENSSLILVEVPKQEKAIKQAKSDSIQANNALDEIDREIEKLSKQLTEKQAEIRSNNSGDLASFRKQQLEIEDKLTDLQIKKREVNSSLMKESEREDQLSSQLKEAQESKTKKKFDSYILVTCCLIFDSVTEEIYQRYAKVYKEIDSATKKNKKISFGTQNRSALEWNLVKVENGRVLLRCVNNVSYRRLDDTGLAHTWEECSLFNWLNNDFCETRFDQFEREVAAFGGASEKFVASIEENGSVLARKTSINNPYNLYVYPVIYIPYFTKIKDIPFFTKTKTK